MGGERGDRSRHCRTELFFGADEVIGGGHQQHRVGILPGDGDRGQRQARGRIAGTRFQQDVVGVYLGQLGTGFLGVPGSRHHPGAVGGDEGTTPAGGLLQQRLLAGEGQKLLGTRPATLGPEPGAASSRHDHQVQHRDVNSCRV